MSFVDRVVDAVGWAIAVAMSRLRNFRRHWRMATARERATLAVDGMWLLCAAVLLVVAWAQGSLPWWVPLVVGVFVGNVAAGVSDMAARSVERSSTARLLEMKPAGAPRMATVTCTMGRQHRFIYGPNGWEESGPSTEVFPDASPAHST